MLARPDQASVLSIIDAARALMPIRRRGANSELYEALVLALQASELCLSDIDQDIALGKAVAELPKGNKNRQYVERGSDAYQRVCRYIFWGEEHTANINRYAIALREAGKQGIRSSGLLKYLRNGGVNQFYLVRPLHRDIITTKCLRLSKQITHRKGEIFTLQLRRLSDNSYEVVEFSSEDRP